MKDNNKPFKNSCYGCLSLRSGVFINSFCTVGFPFLVDFTVRSLERAYGTSSKQDSIPFVSRYYHFALPFMSEPVDAFAVVCNTMHIVGMIGCYKKSSRLIKYHKNYLWLHCIATPFLILESLFTWYNEIWCNDANRQKLGLDRPNTTEIDGSFPLDPKKLLMYCSLFVGGVVAVTYAQQVYSAYVAYNYERYLQFPSNDEKEK